MNNTIVSSWGEVYVSKFCFNPNTSLSLERDIIPFPKNILNPKKLMSWDNTQLSIKMNYICKAYNYTEEILLHKWIGISQAMSNICWKTGDSSQFTNFLWYHDKMMEVAIVLPCLISIIGTVQAFLLTGETATFTFCYINCLKQIELKFY